MTELYSSSLTSGSLLSLWIDGHQIWVMSLHSFWARQYRGNTGSLPVVRPILPPSNWIFLCIALPVILHTWLIPHCNLYLAPCCTYACSAVASYIPCGENPSCLHATLASMMSQDSSHIVVHDRSIHSSTRPWLGDPLRRSTPSSQDSKEQEDVHTALYDYSRVSA
jgi:hypothetical protein